MTGFTPGPWRLTVHTGSGRHVDRNDDWSIDGADGSSICFEGKPNENAHGNAHLIAAAPSLYEALERLIVAVEFEAYPIADGVDVDKRVNILLNCAKDASAALALARGETNG